MWLYTPKALHMGSRNSISEETHVNNWARLLGMLREEALPGKLAKMLRMNDQ